MPVQLSILCPAFRSERWVKMYESIEKSFSGTWELVLVTEMPLPDELKDKKNIKVIFSERSPMGKQQQALESLDGEFVTVAPDDGIWVEGALDKTFEYIKTLPDYNYKTVIVLKYLESEEFDFPPGYINNVPLDMRFKTNWDFMKSDKYYWLGTHDVSRLPGIPHNAPVLSSALYTKKLLLEVGGWDTQFQTQAIGNVDLSARLMNYGCKFYIQNLVASRYGWMPYAGGDHGPLHYAQLDGDEPLLRKMYAVPHPEMTLVLLDNWKNTSEKWEKKDYYNAMKKEGK